jgi:hypothetical protein
MYGTHQLASKTQKQQLTFPSAHLAISPTGSSSRWIEVVHIQCGKPSVATTAQKAKMMKRRVQTALAFSGGGVVFVGVFDGASDVMSVFWSGSAMAALCV